MVFKKAFVFLALSSLFCIISCEKLLVNNSTQYLSSGSRLLLYMHLTSLTPPDIIFTLSEMKIQAEDGNWITLVDEPIDISSTRLIDRQILLKDAIVEPGFYKGIKVRISKASIKGKEGYASLALPQPDGEALINVNIRLRKKESFVVSFAWDPEKSVTKRYLFQPSIDAELQASSPRSLLLFISNSASNYLSVIDRSLERVIGVVTVGDRPMGMALNARQDKLYVVNSGSRSISVVDTTQFSVLDTIQLIAGMEPTDVAFMPNDNSLIEGKLYITNRISNDVAVVDTATRRVIKTVPVGTYPTAIAADTERKEIYVANEKSNNVSIINATNDSLSDTITVDIRPTGLVVRKDKDKEKEKIYVLNEGSNRISIISPSLRKVIASISVVYPPKRGMQGFSGRLFIVNSSANTITFLNSLDVVTRTIPAGIRPIGLAGDEKRNRLYVTNHGGNTVVLLDPIGERVLKEIFVGKSPYGVLLLEQ